MTAWTYLTTEVDDAAEYDEPGTVLRVWQGMLKRWSQKVDKPPVFFAVQRSEYRQATVLTIANVKMAI